MKPIWQIMARRANFDVREDVLMAARNTVQKDGYNAMSFRDLANEVGVKAATVHYHFPTKGDLAGALVIRYREDVMKLLEPLSKLSYDKAISRYIGLFRSFFEDGNQMCLGGMMAAEVTALPDAACQEIERFMDAHIGWLASAMSRKHPGMAAGKRLARARSIFAALEGAQLITRGLGGDIAIFDSIVDSYRAAGLLA